VRQQVPFAARDLCRHAIDNLPASNKSANHVKHLIQLMFHVSPPGVGTHFAHTRGMHREFGHDRNVVTAITNAHWYRRGSGLMPLQLGMWRAAKVVLGDAHDRTQTTTLVQRFRPSHQIAARSFANVGKGTCNLLILVRLLNLKFLNHFAAI
jgi:hypothetical protein